MPWLVAISSLDAFLCVRWISFPATLGTLDASELAWYLGGDQLLSVRIRLRCLMTR